MTLHQTDRLGGVAHFRLKPGTDLDKPAPEFNWYSAIGTVAVLISALGVLLGIAVALGW